MNGNLKDLNVFFIYKIGYRAEKVRSAKKSKIAYN